MTSLCLAISPKAPETPLIGSFDFLLLPVSALKAPAMPSTMPLVASQTPSPKALPISMM